MKTKEVSGFVFRFVRRRYGRRTYTWASVQVGMRWVSCGDPWPGVNWPKKELLEAACWASGCREAWA